MFESMTQRELRGVPFVGGRRSSAIPGSDPLPAVIAKDERGRLFPPAVRQPAAVSVITEPLVVHYERRGAPLAMRGVRESGRFFRRR
jgi:hypothetical protein